MYPSGLFVRVFVRIYFSDLMCDLFVRLFCSRPPDSRVRGIKKARTHTKKTGGTSFFPAPPPFSRAFHIRVLPILSRPPHYLRTCNRLFRIRLPQTRIRWIRHTNLQLFESALQSGNFCTRYQSRIARTLNLDILFIRWRSKIEPSSLPWILYSRWQPRSQVLSKQSKMQISRALRRMLCC